MPSTSSISGPSQLLEPVLTRLIWVLNPEQSRCGFRHWSPARACKRIDLLNEPSEQVIAVVRSRTRLWVVERSFAWLTRCRRLGWDVERLSETVESLIYACMTRLMLRRLA
jgi:transposase